MSQAVGETKRNSKKKCDSKGSYKLSNKKHMTYTWVTIHDQVEDKDFDEVQAWCDRGSTCKSLQLKFGSTTTEAGIVLRTVFKKLREVWNEV